MRRAPLAVLAVMATLTAVGNVALAQRPAPPTGPMTFFVTSVGLGHGAALGGLDGADAHCQRLAAAAGRGGATWHAYLSTQGPAAVNARDRIGRGPWYNARGQLVARSVAQLHGDSLEEAQLGNPLGKQRALTEKAGVVNGVGDTPNQHDMLTGSRPDGRAYTGTEDHTCRNWTSDGSGTAQIGHSDKQGGETGSWNSAHATRGCSQDDLVATLGVGLFYCFAVE